MSAANFLSTQEVANLGASHHSVAMESYHDSEHSAEDVGVAEKPLGFFEKSFFALASGYATCLSLFSLSNPQNDHQE